jgi:hypothetical protein
MYMTVQNVNCVGGMIKLCVQPRICEFEERKTVYAKCVRVGPLSRFLVWSDILENHVIAVL